MKDLKKKLIEASNVVATVQTHCPYPAIYKKSELLDYLKNNCNIDNEFYNTVKSKYMIFSYANMFAVPIHNDIEDLYLIFDFDTSVINNIIKMVRKIGYDSESLDLLLEDYDKLREIWVQECKPFHHITSLPRLNVQYCFGKKKNKLNLI